MNPLSTRSNPSLVPVHPKEFRKLLERERTPDEDGSSEDFPQPDGQTPDQAFEPPEAAPVDVEELEVPVEVQTTHQDAAGVPAVGPEEVLGRIRDGFDGITRTLSGIEQRLDAQNKSSDELVQTVKVLPEAVRDLPQQSKAGVELLGTISEALKSQTEVTREVVGRMESLANTVMTIPKSLNDLNTRLDQQEAGRAKLQRSVDDMQSSMTEMHTESLKAHRDTIDEFRNKIEVERDENRKRHEVMTEVVERTGRQSQVMVVVMILLILAFLAFVIKI